MKRRRLRKKVHIIFTAVTRSFDWACMHSVCSLFQLMRAHLQIRLFTNIIKVSRSSPATHSGKSLKRQWTSEYDSVPEYVEVLKEMNSLKSDDIEAGQHLIIAYNDAEFIKYLWYQYTSLCIDIYTLRQSGSRKSIIFLVRSAYFISWNQNAGAICPSVNRASFPHLFTGYH